MQSFSQIITTFTGQMPFLSFVQPTVSEHRRKTFTLHYIQIYNAPYMSIRKWIWSAAMVPEQLHTAGFKQFSFKTVFKSQKHISWTGVDINRVPDCRSGYKKHTRLKTVKDIKDDVLRCNTGQWTHNMVAEQWNKMMSHFRCTSLQQVQTAMQRRYLGWQVSALQSRLDYLHNALNYSRVL